MSPEPCSGRASNACAAATVSRTPSTQPVDTRPAWTSWQQASSLNLAEPLADGAKVVVPELGMEAAALVTPADGRIDLNTADQAALESLPGIGPVTAGEIMVARSDRAFASVGELLDRDIVGQAVYDDIVDLVRVSR